MFNSFTSLFPKSPEAWDTSCARKYLKISDEELKKLDPGWTLRKQQFNKKSVAEQGSGVTTDEGPLTNVLVNPESTVRSFQKAHATGVLVDKSILPPRKKAKLTTSYVEEIISNNSLQSINIGNSSVTPTSSRTCSTSALPDIGNMSTTLSQSNKSPAKRLLLDTTYVVSSVLEDKTNDIEIISDIQSQTSSTHEVSSKKRTFEKLGTESSCQEIPEENLPKSGDLHAFQINPLSAQAGHVSFLNKKLRLLEKRFSPSKDFSVTPSQEAIMAQVNLTNVESQKSVSMSVPNPNEVSSSQEHSHSETNIEVQKMACIHNSQKDIAVGNELLKKEYTEGANKKSKASVFEEESFVSLPIPCGQPLPSNPYNLTIKSQVVKPPVANSIVERNSSKKCSSEVLVQEAVSIKANKVGRKKKLKSKGESTSRKSDSSKSLVYIQYTAEQMRKMIDMLNNFHSAM